MTRKIVLPGLLLVPWLVLCIICLESIERICEGRRLAAGEALGRAIWDAIAEEDAAVIARQGVATPVVGTDMDARQHFLDSDEAERLAWARERGEVVAIVDDEGLVDYRYDGAALPPLAQLSERLRPGVSMMSPLPPMEAADAQQALAAALASGNCAQRDYPIPMDDDVRHVFQFTFCATADPAFAALFIRDSIWEVLWQRFKGGIAQNDLYDVRINRAGFRDREIALPKPRGLTRILCLGGSTTFEGPSNALTYPKMLERMLRERFGEDQVEVLNCGVIASTTHNELVRMPEVLALQPDLIIHYNFVNDLTFLLPVWIQSHHDAGLTGRLRRALSNVYLARRHARDFLLPPTRVLQENIDKQIMANIREMRRLAQEEGVDFAVAGFAYPDPTKMPPQERPFFNHHLANMQWGRMVDLHAYARITQYYNQLLRRWADEEDILFIPVDAHLDGGMTQFRDICHMHLGAMETKASVIADALVPYLEERIETP